MEPTIFIEWLNLINLSIIVLIFKYWFCYKCHTFAAYNIIQSSLIAKSLLLWKIWKTLNKLDRIINFDQSLSVLVYNQPNLCTRNVQNWMFIPLKSYPLKHAISCKLVHVCNDDQLASRVAMLFLTSSHNLNSLLMQNSTALVFFQIHEMSSQLSHRKTHVHDVNALVRMVK